MYIEKKSHYDPLSNIPFWETLDRYSYYDGFDYIIGEIENIIKALNLLLSKDYKSITDEEYYNIVKQFYDITFFKEDIPKILSIIDKINYDKYQMLKTKVVYTTLESEGHGRDFSWWHETRQMVLELITPKGLNIDNKHNYSNKEIEDILNNYKIYLFNTTSKKLGIDPELPFRKEKTLDIEIPKIIIEKNYYTNDDFDDYLNLELEEIKCDDLNLNDAIKQIAYKLVRKKIRPTTVLKFSRSIFESIYNDINYYQGEILKCSFISEKEKEELIQKVKTLINKMGEEKTKMILNKEKQKGLH